MINAWHGVVGGTPFEKNCDFFYDTFSPEIARRGSRTPIHPTRATCRVYTPRANTGIVSPFFRLHMAFGRLDHHSLLGLCLVFAAQGSAAAIPGRALVPELSDARRPPLPLAAPFAPLRRAAGKQGCALVRGLSDARLAPLLQGLGQFIDIQVLWAIVKTATQALGDSVHVADFFAPRKVLDRLLLYTCTVVVLRLVEPPTVCQFITTQAVLVGWLACTGRQVAPVFEWQRVLERFSVYLLQLQRGTMRKSADNDVIRRHN